MRLAPCAARAAACALALAAWAAVAAPLRVCIADDSAPYSAREGAQAAGLDVALMQAVAGQLDRELQLVWFEGRYDKEGNLSLDARALLAAQVCDLVAGVPLYAPQLAPMIADKARTPDHPGARPLRQRPYQVLVPVVGGAPYRASALVLVGRSGAQPARSLDELRGRRVAVRAGSMASLALGAWQGGVLAPAIRGFNLREDVLAALEAGEADAALVDIALWDRHRAAHPGTPLAPTGYEHPLKINIGILARSSDEPLLRSVEAALGRVTAAGTAGLGGGQTATWVQPVLPTVRETLTLRDFAGPGG